MTGGPAAPAMELWGGIECTVNRVGDRYHDQLEWSGHAGRVDDIDRVAALGLRTVRYPVLWERVAPDGVERARWDWPDERLGRMRSLGLDPIVGLVHHGSGPRATSLVDADFPTQLARYARAVAERYPWVRRWTPINEPLTTARFSTLYGLWYPHAHDDRRFARAIVGQCRAIALAMCAIREVRPDAELVQTEDLGRTYATPLLGYQAEFENERRWLTFDLLGGRLDRGHPMWDFLRGAGIAEDELKELHDEPCPPDVVGINYYLTSERFLDERVEQYPERVRGSNGRHAYADVEAARVRVDGVGGPGEALAAAWARYRRPLAITEAHLGCTREQQLRWLHEVWTSALAQREAGVDVRAVTVWALFGAFEWQSLVTRIDGAYEPGAFDVRTAPPRPTALATMVRDLATRGSHHHPALDGPGWWSRPRRLAYPAVDAHGRCEAWASAALPGDEVAGGRPVLVVGGDGALGRVFVQACAERHLAAHTMPLHELDGAGPELVERTLDALAPWGVIDATGCAGLVGDELEPGPCERDHGALPLMLADACARRGIALLVLSSFRVFDGERDAPYLESAPARPLHACGRGEHAAERGVLRRMPDALVARIGPCFAPWNGDDYVAGVLRTLECGLPVQADHEQVVSPTYAPDLASVALDLLTDGERGVWHLANVGAVTRAELSRLAARTAGLDPALVQPGPGRALPPRMLLPRYGALGSERGSLLPSLDDALGRYLAARAHHTQTA